MNITVIIVIIIVILLALLIGVILWVYFRKPAGDPNNIADVLVNYNNYKTPDNYPYSFKIANNAMQVAYYDPIGYRKGINVFNAAYTQPYINQLILSNFAVTSQSSDLKPISPWILTMNGTDITLTLTSNGTEKNTVLHQV